MFTGILAATDLLRGSGAVLKMAHELARSSGATVHVCTALSTSTDPMLFGEAAPAEQDRSGDQHRKELERMKQALREHAVQAGFSAGEFEVHVFDLLPGEEIPRAARQLNCDLIVIGTRSTSRSGRFGIGTEAERILNCATVPVLVVPPVPEPQSATSKEGGEGADSSHQRP